MPWKLLVMMCPLRCWITKDPGSNVPPMLTSNGSVVLIVISTPLGAIQRPVLAVPELETQWISLTTPVESAVTKVLFPSNPLPI